MSCTACSTPSTASAPAAHAVALPVVTAADAANALLCTADPVHDVTKPASVFSNFSNTAVADDAAPLDAAAAGADDNDARPSDPAAPDASAEPPTTHDAAASESGAPVITPAAEDEPLATTGDAPATEAELLPSILQADAPPAETETIFSSIATSHNDVATAPLVFPNFSNTAVADDAAPLDDDALSRAAGEKTLIRPDSERSDAQERELCEPSPRRSVRRDPSAAELLPSMLAPGLLQADAPPAESETGAAPIFSPLPCSTSQNDAREE